MADHPLPLLEKHLAWALRQGTRLATLIVLAGLAIAFATRRSLPAHLPVVTVGLACFIALPILRVAWMLTAFLRARDFRFGLVAASVLIIIAIGLAMGHGVTARP